MLHLVWLPKKESAALARLSREKELAPWQVLRQALRLYHDIDLRLARGEQVFMTDPDCGCGSGE